MFNSLFVIQGETKIMLTLVLLDTVSNSSFKAKRQKPEDKEVIELLI